MFAKLDKRHAAVSRNGAEDGVWDKMYILARVSLGFQQIGNGSAIGDAESFITPKPPWWKSSVGAVGVDVRTL